MQYPTYGALTVSPDYTIYRFISYGQKGRFEIEVQFTAVEGTTYYSLGFGILNETRQMDDLVVLNNGDRDRILATVSGFVDEFLQVYPDKGVFFSGSTPARTRLYRRAISINQALLSARFDILGFNIEEDLTLEPFCPANNYDGFVVLKKTIFET